MTDLIPLNIQTQRVLQLLARQIYQSPLALLRENTQNAFDAVRLRMQAQPDFREPRIDIVFSDNKIVIADNGIGMTPRDLQEHYWTAGSSSKNNESARAAGVVGTFGIGAMANFGIADRLEVETESAISGERTRCRADREKLDIKTECIEREILPSQGTPGTTITAYVEPGAQINLPQARAYISEFVSLVEVPVTVNGEKLSQNPPEIFVSKIAATRQEFRENTQVGKQLRADVAIAVSVNADVRLEISNIYWNNTKLAGRLVLRSGHANLRTFRSGFGLATASVSSPYQLGGVADLMVLEPTAGREAITADGLNILQAMMTEIDALVSEFLAAGPECDSSTPFMQWVVNHGRYDLCSNLRMSITPGDRITLSEVAKRTTTAPMLLYNGSDAAIIKEHASEDQPLLVSARLHPRRQCEDQFLARNAKVELISNAPMAKNIRRFNQMTTAEKALAFRLELILETDYFINNAVQFGEISHGLPVLAEQEKDLVRVTLNAAAPSARILLDLYETEPSALAGMTKDFVRNIVFSRITQFVPSSTRQGAEAFLRAIRKQREIFEYASDDLGVLPSIWEDYGDGKISLDQAVSRSKSAVRASVQVVERAIPVQDVVPDVISNEEAFRKAEGTPLDLEALPSITRLEEKSSAKLLTIEEKDPALRSYRCFIAITDKAREEMGEFFLQPHSTSIVWGGQKTLFIFMHHSKTFGLYYDLQTKDLVQAPTGGGAYPTCTIVLKDRIYIPIPDEIKSSFIPADGEKKRFEIRTDVLRTEPSKSGEP